MQRPRSLSSLRLLAVAALLPVLMTPAPADTTCSKKNNGCKSVTTFSVYTGNPTVICPIGHPVVQIDSRAFCGGDLADGAALLLRCGVSSTPFSYMGAVAMHSFSTSSNWETVLAGACGDFSYSAMPW
jgi:hypothetical protein